MAARRARNRFAFKRSAKHNQIWTAAIQSAVTVSTTTIEDNIVEGADWQAKVGFAKATVLSIRGWISIRKVATVATATDVFFAIYLVDEDDGVHAPNNATSYTDEDVLWTHGVSFAAGTATSVEPYVGITIPVHVKVARNINNGQEVRLSMISNAGVNHQVSSVLRGLVRLGN